MKKKAKTVKAIVPEVVEGGTYVELVNAIGGLLERARSKIAAVANFELVKTYWETGRYIVEYEHHLAQGTGEEMREGLELRIMNVELKEKEI